MNYPSQTPTSTPTPDLASILRTLSQHTNTTSLTTPTTTTHRNPSTQYQNYNNNHNQPYSHTQSHSRNHHQSHHAYPQQTPIQNQSSHSQTAPIPIPIPGPISGKPPTDPSRLTTYPSALRYTSALLASNAQLTHRIKTLIRSQHEHERQWWAGRALIPDECRKRAESRKAVADVLRRLNQGAGAETNANVGMGDGDDDGIETALREYDRKVHGKCLEMQRDVRRQLKEYGIPGFVVRAELVGDGPGKVSRHTIMELEGRMLLLLEDLCRD